jgi:phosphohistidine swiveling domain-containing protein
MTLGPSSSTQPSLPLVVWLADLSQDDRPLAGGKAAILGELARAGLPVPPGFCLTTAAYRSASHAVRLPTAVAEPLLEAYQRLRAQAPTGRVSVRSSATVEDLPEASFAGQGLTELDVADADSLLEAVRACWTSLDRASALAYRAGTPAEMAVLIQAMVPADASGVAFSRDPVTGTEVVVVEAVPGLGEALVGGRVTPERYRQPGPEPRPGALLDAATLADLVALVKRIEAMCGMPQDVEWALWQGGLHVLQSRPITAGRTGFYDAISPAGAAAKPGDAKDTLWSSGFLNERFSQVVSPLGWSLIRSLLEPLAFQHSLQFLGCADFDTLPLTRLYRGHPFANVAIFQRLYAVFPDWLLPEDARRHFPGGDTSLRHAVAYPRSILAPRTFWSLVRTFVGEFPATMPWLNAGHWQRFAHRHAAQMDALEARTPQTEMELWKDLDALRALDRQLLAIHRWSLTVADLAYSTLRRLVLRWTGDIALPARLVVGLPSLSVQLDAALRRVASAAEKASDPDAAIWDGLADVLARFGHRALTLDLYHAPFRANPEQVAALVRGLIGQPPPAPPDPEAAERDVCGRVGPLRWALLRPVLSLARQQMLLREEQRFTWQRSLALQRERLLGLGQHWVDQGWLETPQQVFFATWEEVRAARSGARPPLAEIRPRQAEHARLEADHRRAPGLTYPLFLRGDVPLDIPPAAAAVWQGQPVSPGVGRGPARIILTPHDFDRIAAGDVLVTRSVDPGWTPLFGRLAGLVMEVGGQLSHGAVVAREYGLPAVVGLPGISRQLQDGQHLVVDGQTGRVVVSPSDP